MFKKNSIKATRLDSFSYNTESKELVVPVPKWNCLRPKYEKNVKKLELDLNAGFGPSFKVSIFLDIRITEGPKQHTNSDHPKFSSTPITKAALIHS
jgi:hypothetical protein